MRIRTQQQSGATLVEVLVGAILMVAFFAGVFEINAVCLRYIAAAKETAAAIAVVNDRVETLRNLSFSDLVTTGSVTALLTEPANSSTFATERAQEVITLSAFPAPNGVTRFTRGANGQLVLSSTASNLGSSLVKVEVACTWTAVFGGRERTERATTIVSNGTKK
jgi:Tfp pilus assembly protein PilV